MRLLIITILILFSSYSFSQKQKVKIAFVGNITGEASSNGIGGSNAFVLALHERNKNSSLKYEYIPVVKNDHCDSGIGSTVASEIAIDTKITCGVVHYCSRVAVSTVDIYHKYNFPVIVWGAVLKDITHSNNYDEVFRICGYQRDQNETAAKFMIDQKFKNWVIIHDTSRYGISHNEYFSEFLLKNGGNILATYSISSSESDMRPILNEAKIQAPDVVYFAGLSEQGAILKKQMDIMSFNCHFQGTSGIIGQDFIDAVGASNAEGIIAVREGKPINKLDGSEAFIGKYERAVKESIIEGDYDSYSAFPYVAANLLIDAIEEAGPNREKIIEYLKKVERPTSIIGAIKFDKNGQNIGNKSVTVFVVENGQWKEWEESKYKGTILREVLKKE